VTNQYVTTALPDLGVDQMTWVARQLERQTFEGGATIVNQGDMADRFFIITRGEVEIVLPHPDGQEIVVDRLQRGQYFGEVGLLSGGTRTATARAAPETEVEVASLSRDDFSRLMQDSNETRDVMEQITQERVLRDQSHSS
jgi:sulfate-transporting ATPase